MVQVMNRDLRKNASDIRVWNIVQADMQGLIFRDANMLSLLFKDVNATEIATSSKPALQRLQSLSDAHKTFIESMKLSDNLRELLAKPKKK